MGSGWGQDEDKADLSADHLSLLENCLEPKALAELLELMGKRSRSKLREQILIPLLEQGLLERTIPGRPTSKNQKYRTTEQGKRKLNHD